MTKKRRTEHPSGVAAVRAFRLSPYHLAALDRYARRRKLRRGAALRELIEKMERGAGYAARSSA